MKLIPLISTLVILTVGLSCKNEEKETQETANYKVIQPLRMDTTYVQEYIADIQAVQNIEIRAKVTGFLDKQFIDEGKFVQNGQLLFKLSDNVFKEELQRAKINKKLALTELKALEIELKNTEKLLTNNIVAKTEVELIKIKIEAAKAKLEMADAEVSKALLHVSFTEVKAPFQGVVNRIPFKAGSLIEEGTVLTTLANNSQMYVYFNLSEIDYLAYQKEHPNNKVQEVTLLLANNEPYPFKGIVETMEGEIDKSTGNIAFRAKFPNPNQLLKHGSSGKILIEKKANNALVIPQKSTFDIQENIYVYLVDKNNVVKMQKIDVGLKFDNLFVVAKGLQVGDRILYEGVQLVKEGEKIKTEEIPSKKMLEPITKQP